jgi:hypothetical protein
VYQITRDLVPFPLFSVTPRRMGNTKGQKTKKSPNNEIRENRNIEYFKSMIF